MAHIDDVRAEYERLLHSFEYAYAMGARRSMGERDPRLDWVVTRVEELRRELAALREEQRDEPREGGEDET
jgi:hypothetical protein